MKKLFKISLILLASFIGMSVLPSCKKSNGIGNSASSGIKNKKMSKRNSNGEYNPYINSKNKPSEIQAKETQWVGKKQNRIVRKQKRKAKKQFGS